MTQVQIDTGGLDLSMNVLGASLIASIVGMPDKLCQFESWYDAMLVSNGVRDKSQIYEIGYMDTKLLMTELCKMLQ